MLLFSRPRLCLLLSVFCLLVNTAQAKSFPGNGLLARLNALAARASLNLIVNAPDRSLGDFKPSESQSDIEQLLAIADAASCTADCTGSVWLITARERHTFQNSSGWQFFYPSDGPIESLMTRKKDSHATDTITFMVPSVNACIISGDSRRTAAAAERLQSLEKPAIPAELQLDITGDNSAQTASLSLQVLTNTSFSFELTTPGFEPIVATASLACDTSGSFSLTIDNAEAKASDADKSLNSQLQQVSQQPGPLLINNNGNAVTINWNARLLRPFTEKTDKNSKNAIAGRAGLKTTSPQPDPATMMNTLLLNEPVAEILGRIAASESCNLVVDKAISGNLSVFFFGPDLYFEEQLNRIARSVGGGIRKIGNTWMVAPENRFVDAFDFGYNITKRLQYSDAEATAAILKAGLAAFNAPANCRVASDRVINAIILAGSADITDGLMRLLAELDHPPVLFDSRLSLQSDMGDFSEIFGINTGRISGRQIALKDATAEIELLPVRLRHMAEPGLKIRTSIRLESGLKLKLAFWSALSESDSRPVIAFNGSSTVSLFISGSKSDSQFADHRYLSHEAEDESGGETDDAFESSF